MNKELFLSPPDDCRETDLWVLNDQLSDAELIRQLHSIHSQGIHSVIVRTFVGLKSDYPGPEFKRMMHSVVEEAKRLGMTLFMQAGYMPEAVLDLPEEYVLDQICPFPKGEEEGEIFCTHGKVSYCRVKSQNILDMMNPEAMKFYLHQSYDEMWEEFTEEFGKTIAAIWVDEPNFERVLLPWTPGFLQAFESLWGNVFPKEKIWLLFEDGPGDEKLRYRFHRTVLYLMQEGYFRCTSDWSKKTKVMFSGHLMAEDTMWGQIRAGVFTMPCYQYMSIPGIDFLEAALNFQYGEIRPPYEEDFHWRHFAAYNTPIQCASAAHQNGQEKILCEICGVSTENLNLRDQKTLFDHFLAMGINHRTLHGLFYSLGGRGKRLYPPHIQDYQPYWPLYHHLTDAVARESWFLRQGKPVRDTVLIHPMDSAFCLYRCGSDNSGRIRRYDIRFNETLRALVAMHENFELGDEDSIASKGFAGREGFGIGKMTYKNVILPYMLNIRNSTLQLLKSYISGGGNVIVLGNYPDKMDGEEAADSIYSLLAGADFVKDHTELERLLAETKRSYIFESDDDGSCVEIQYRKDGEDRLIFLTDTDRHMTHRGRLILDGIYHAQRLFPEDGSFQDIFTIRDNGRTIVPVEIHPGEALLLYLMKDGKKRDTVQNRKSEHILSLSHRWKLTRLDPNVFLMERFRFAKGNEKLSEEEYPILAIQSILTKEHYFGEITLESCFESEIDLDEISLVLEKAKECRITLDEQVIDSCPTGYYRNPSWETIRLKPLSKGVHTLRLQRFFAPVERGFMPAVEMFQSLPGTELEQILLIGNFAVHSCIEACTPPVIRMCPHFIITGEKESCGDEIVANGYPFYAGVMSMEKRFYVGEESLAGDCVLSADAVLAGAAEVYLNGKLQGEFLWHPYELSLRGIRKGENVLEIKLYGTLRNLLGPWHRPAGEIGAAWDNDEFQNLPWLGAQTARNQFDREWYTDRIPDKPGWTESYLFLPMGIVNVQIRSRQEKIYTEVI